MREHRRRITTPTHGNSIVDCGRESPYYQLEHAQAQAQAGPASSSMAAQRFTRSAGRRTLDTEDSSFHFYHSQRVLFCCTACMYIPSFLRLF